MAPGQRLPAVQSAVAGTSTQLPWFRGCSRLTTFQALSFLVDILRCPSTRCFGTLDKIFTVMQATACMGQAAAAQLNVHHDDAIRTAEAADHLMRQCSPHRKVDGNANCAFNLKWLTAILLEVNLHNLSMSNWANNTTLTIWHNLKWQHYTMLWPDLINVKENQAAIAARQRVQVHKTMHGYLPAEIVSVLQIDFKYCL